MKKIFAFNLLVLLLACDDGDLEIETIDFDSASIQYCGDISVVEANVLFKLNETEALILELPNGAIVNQVSDGPLEYAVTSSGPAVVTYRTFSANVSQDYFCNEVPLTEPQVLEEIIGEGGTVYITTTVSTDSTGYLHDITLEGISLVTSTDSRITNLAIDNFGTVTTIASSDTEETGG